MFWIAPDMATVLWRRSCFAWTGRPQKLCLMRARGWLRVGAIGVVYPRAQQSRKVNARMGPMPALEALRLNASPYTAATDASLTSSQHTARSDSLVLFLLATQGVRPPAVSTCMAKIAWLRKFYPPRSDNQTALRSVRRLTRCCGDAPPTSGVPSSLHPHRTAVPPRSRAPAGATRSPASEQTSLPSILIQKLPNASICLTY